MDLSKEGVEAAQDKAMGAFQLKVQSVVSLVVAEVFLSSGGFFRD